MVDLLFQVENLKPSSRDIRPVVDTPLGAICIAVEIDDRRQSRRPDFSYDLDQNRHLLIWEDNGLHAELLLIQFRPDLPSDLQIQECWAAVWRVQASENLGRCRFVAEWEDGYTWSEGGPESGEGLDAQTWWDVANMVTVGTQDGESLLRRAREGDHLPARWSTAESLGCSDPACLSLVEYGGSFLSVPLPEMRPGDLCQVHFVIAWSGVDQDVATWFAVDQVPEVILRSASVG
jgi:hypothetical protein